MMNKLKALVKDEQGQGMTEYGLVLGIIGVAVVGTLIALREEISAIFTEVQTTIETRPTNP